MMVSLAFIYRFRIMVCGAAVLMTAACSSSDRSPTQYTEDPETVSGLSADPLPGTVLAGRPPKHGFYPLDIGNTWSYWGQWQMYIVGDSIATASLYGERRELRGIEELFGRPYMVETQKRWSRPHPFPPTDSNTLWIRYRQDRAGLYEADYAASIPPGPALAASFSTAGSLGPFADAWSERQQRFSAVLASSGNDAYQEALMHLVAKVQAVEAALRTMTPRQRPRSMGGNPPGGVLPAELTRLKYPLFPRQHWVIRDDPYFEATVRSHRRFNLPAGLMTGWVILIASELFYPQDRVEVWYGRNGFLGMRAHLEGVATDELGNPIGTLVSDETLKLVDFTLGRRSP